MLLFLIWVHWLSHPPGAGLQCSWVPHLGLENSLPFCSRFGNVVPYCFENMGSIKLTIVEVWGYTDGSTSSFLSAEDMRRGVQKLWCPRRTPAGWAVSASEPLQSPHSPSLPTLLSRACLFPFLYWSTCLILFYPGGQKGHSGFSVRSYGETQTNFLAHPILALIGSSFRQLRHSVNSLGIPPCWPVGYQTLRRHADFHG